MLRTFRNFACCGLVFSLHLMNFTNIIKVTKNTTFLKLPKMINYLRGSSNNFYIDVAKINIIRKT